ncbi:MAG: YggT family protein [Rhodospirillaceae bacterium]|jgi:YggT family protein|nr:YggT family protein [Rhodospirillaceae bacterium]
MVAVAQLIDWVIQIYIWVLIASAVLSWLLAFGIVNRYNPVVVRVGQFCDRLTEPLLRPIRRVLPLIAGVDLSPLVLILLLMFLRNLLFEYLVYR